jgi:hypothetical protein
LNNSFQKQDVLAACQRYGPLLESPDGLDGAHIMGAIATNESSLGLNCGPRHEPSYDVGGAIYNGSTMQQSLVREFGTAAACSFGPWQMMFINCPGYMPADLETNVEDCARCFVSFFNSYVIHARKAQNLNEIGQVWNAGHISAAPAPGVLRYCADLQQAYDVLVFQPLALPSPSTAV